MEKTLLNVKTDKKFPPQFLFTLFSAAITHLPYKTSKNYGDFASKNRD